MLTNLQAIAVDDADRAGDVGKGRGGKECGGECQLSSVLFPARLIPQVRVPFDKNRHLHLDCLSQKTPRPKAQNLRQRIL